MTDWIVGVGLSPTAAQWDALNASVGGQLHKGTPLALPCFSSFSGTEVQPYAQSCAVVEANYTSTEFISSVYSGFMQPQWATCQQSQMGCLLDSDDPSDSAAFANKTCFQGSVSPYYLDVRNATDVQIAFNFSQETGTVLSIKNSGHDYKGRSSAPDSLALWVHNLNSISYDAKFVPEGCSSETTYQGVTSGTGASWQDVYEFADSHNITVVGGYHQTVASSGGWLMGGGHSVLSPVYGLGVDRVLQFKIVTPDGELRTVNECQNTDLFWALRGGGGGTFGVVLEATHKAEPQLTLQVAAMEFNVTTSNLEEFYTVLVNNSLQWGLAGWGGHVAENTFIYVNPLLSLDEATASMKPMVDFINLQNGSSIITTVPSWLEFFNEFALAGEAPVGTELLLGSRLIPKSVFETPEGQSAMVKVLLQVSEHSLPYIPVVPPILFNATENSTSTTPAWRDALWHLNAFATWDFNSSFEEINAAYNLTHEFVDMFRQIAPDSGSYINECDVHETDFEESFWGPNYPRLLEIKQKYDPNHLLDCWQCVGWLGASDDRYSCYI
ncbi:FAD-binding domain-containing protein [Schizopora paradoxa]|uniref:FAD-binding domain-containing protein n=1 Tax=Schizopora paradoxa TaxID=27342 RepID=A0A0H2R8H9_9AGAM|nr:FAD-binding domain-containing protein [Schizopora paradoxa]